jgi:hypothetical protein
MKPTPNKPNAKQRFFDTYKDHSEKELLIELIWNLKRSYYLQEKVRHNTSKLVWWLIAIPFIVVTLFACMTFAGITTL